MHRHLLLFLLLVGLFAARLQAQVEPREYDVSIGAMTTTSRFTTVGGVGPLFRFGVLQRPVRSHVRFRLDASVFAVSTRPNEYTTAGIRAVAVGYSALVGPRPRGNFAYVMFGVGVLGGSNTAPDAWPGVLLLAQTGVGVRATVLGTRLHAEVAVATSAGAPSRALYVPLTFGVSF